MTRDALSELTVRGMLNVGITLPPSIFVQATEVIE
jgi:hypothetical protein